MTGFESPLAGAVHLLHPWTYRIRSLQVNARTAVVASGPGSSSGKPVGRSPAK